MPKSRLNYVGLVVIALLIHNCSIGPVYSAPGNNQNNNPWGLNKSRESFASQVLKEQPELPQLPTYSGKSKFVSGHVDTNDQGWVTYSISSLVIEDPDQVRNWYQNAFNMYQWKTLNAGESTITADQKNGNMCAIVVNPSDETGYHTSLQISYSIPPQGTFPSDIPEN